MSFGEVGITTEQVAEGYSGHAHGIGHFVDTKILERMTLLAELNWADGLSGPLYYANLMTALVNTPRNLAVLQQFHFFRANIEVTIRLNTNQFYYGALMVTMFPTITTGQRRDERCVLDPALISASSAESLIKVWKYSYPEAWLDLVRLADPVTLVVDQFVPLSRAKQDMPETITVQVWGRFTDVQLSFPTGASAQSGSGPMPKIKLPMKKNRSHPNDDPSSGGGLGNIVSAIESTTISDIVSDVSSVAGFVLDNWGGVGSLLGGLFDKPDLTDPQTAMIVEGSKDLFASDIPDTNVCISTYKSRYADPGAGRMPMTKNWTISDYARIPGLRGLELTPYRTFVDKGDQFDLNLIQAHPDFTTMKTPLDYAWLSSLQWRGSLKVCIMFFTSSFISARFVVQYTNTVDAGTGFPVDYTNGMSRVINVKGDVIDTFTLPWNYQQWWSDTNHPYMRIKCDSAIASTDTVSEPKIYALIWVAGGDDIQFAYPIPVEEPQWAAKAPPGLERAEAQSSPGSIFKDTFPPLGENTFYDIDRGFCTSEVLGPITDICKRYSQYEGGPNPLDAVDATNSTIGLDAELFRMTLFGSWRAAFLFRSGGYKLRYYNSTGTPVWWAPYKMDEDGFYKPVRGTKYVEPFDKISRLTVPQLGPYPYCILGRSNKQLTLRSTPSLSPSGQSPMQIAARDDLQFGYPILPKGLFVVP